MIVVRSLAVVNIYMYMYMYLGVTVVGETVEPDETTPTGVGVRGQTVSIPALKKYANAINHQYELSVRLN